MAPTIDTEMFLVREANGLRLIMPTHVGAVANAPWSRETLWHRSRVETLDGQTVSQSFGKFFNANSGPEGLQVTLSDIIAACERGEAYATLKLDGSTLVRSVYAGDVMLRTRGSFGIDHLGNVYEMAGFREKYPEVFNKRLFQQLSLLFEWTSPNNVIVLKYPEPDLTLIGAVDHATMQYLPLSHLQDIAEALGTPLVPHFKLDTAGWQALYGALDNNHDIEGYVIRLNHEQTLVKVKCAPYLTKHAIKSTLSTEKLADLYFQQGRPSFTQFCENFKSAFDEETCMWALGAISSLYDGVKQLDAIEAHMRTKAQGRQGMTRKEAALAGLAEYGQTKRFAVYMLMWQGRDVETDLLKSILLQNAKQVEISMFEKTEA